MRIITCASYGYTGSSAITDLVSEYNNVKNFSDYEFRFVHDPYGISDLEYNLVENHNRHNSGHALKKYESIVKFHGGNIFAKRYEIFFKGNWKKISMEYIDELMNFKSNGWWQYDLIEKGELYYYLKLLPNKILKKTIWKNDSERHLNILPKEHLYYSNPTEEEFLIATRKYINKLFESISDGYDDVMLDQVVPPSNIDRYLRYFDDIKVFVVDRDPRDLYYSAKYIWKTKIIPTESIDLYCKWYIYTRDHRKKEIFNKSQVMYIQFEDLIYKYESIINEIENFLGYFSENHINMKEKFIPEISKNNTMTWIDDNREKENIKYIENELNEYLYKFDEV